VRARTQDSVMAKESPSTSATNGHAGVPRCNWAANHARSKQNRLHEGRRGVVLAHPIAQGTDATLVKAGPSSQEATFEALACNKQ